MRVQSHFPHAPFTPFSFGIPYNHKTNPRGVLRNQWETCPCSGMLMLVNVFVCLSFFGSKYFYNLSDHSRLEWKVPDTFTRVVLAEANLLQGPGMTNPVITLQSEGSAENMNNWCLSSSQTQHPRNSVWVGVTCYCRVSGFFLLPNSPWLTFH